MEQMNAPPAYFKHATAWRAAWWDMMDIDDPEEVPTKGRESLTGLRFVPYTQPDTVNEKDTADAG